MKPRLIRTTGAFPPGGYQFVDRITGKSYTDLHTQFDSRVEEIIRDRKANARLFTDQRFVDTNHVSIELSEFNCARINNDRNYCSDGGIHPAPVNLPVAAGRVCRKCAGTVFTERLCATCSGRRVIALVCDKCGQEMPP